MLLRFYLLCFVSYILSINPRTTTTTSGLRKPPELVVSRYYGEEEKLVRVRLKVLSKTQDNSYWNTSSLLTTTAFFLSSQPPRRGKWAIVLVLSP